MQNIKKNIAIALLLFLFSFPIIAQENRVIDKKTHITEELIQSLLSGKEAEAFSKENTNTEKSLQSFTDDSYEDIELHAAINPLDSSNIIISWMKMDPGSSTNPLMFQLYYTNDFGQNWQQGNIDFLPRTVTPPNEAQSGGGDPMIVFDKFGKAYISWIQSIIRVVSADEIYVDFYLTYASSTDKGANWSSPDSPDKYISYGTMEYTLQGGFGDVLSGSFPDKQWMAVNPVNNDIFVSLAEFNTTNNYFSGIDTWGVRRKPADQTVFDDKVLVPPVGTQWAQLGSLAMGKDGTVHTIYPYYHLGFPEPALERLVHVSSTDNGQTYSDPTAIADIDVTHFVGVGQTNNTSTNAYSRMYPSTYIAIDTSSTSQYEGRIYAVWNSNDANYIKKMDIYLSYSDDDGSSWTTPKIVNSDPPRDYGFHHHPTIYVNCDGVVALAWYDNRGHEIPHVYMNDYYYALSFDGGETFEENKVSSQAFNYNADGFEKSVGIGEYFQVIASKHHVITFYSAFDGEDTELYYDIFRLDGTTRIEEKTGKIISNVSVKIYPNPTSNFINIDHLNPTSELATYTLVDITGKIVLQKEQMNKLILKTSLNVSELPKGLYILNIQEGNTKIAKKIQID